MRQTDFRDHVQERTLAHEALVKTQRALVLSLLNPVVESRQGLSGLELATRNVRSGATSHTLQKLKS